MNLTIRMAAVTVAVTATLSAAAVAPVAASASAAHSHCPSVTKIAPATTHGHLRLAASIAAGIVGRPGRYRDVATVEPFSLDDEASHTIRGRGHVYFQLDSSSGKRLRFGVFHYVVRPDSRAETTQHQRDLEGSLSRFAGRRVRGVYEHNGKHYATRWVTLPAHASGVCDSYPIAP